MRKIETIPSGNVSEVLDVAWPIVVSMLSYTMMGVVDTLMVARLGTTEVAATGIASVAVFLTCAFGWGLCNAVKIAVSHSYGAGDRAGVLRATQQGLLLAAALGLVVMLALLAPTPILRALGAKGDVLSLAVSYYKPRVLGVLPMFLSIAAFGYFQGLGNTTTPMRVQVVANLLNVGLDAVLIFGLGPIPALGVEGAALATALAFGLQGVVALWLLRGSVGSGLSWSFNGFRRLLRLGLPMGLRFFLEIGSWAAFTSIVARTGEAHLAAHTIVVRIISVSFLPGHGIGEAASILCGQAVGAGRFEVARRAVGNATLICMATMGGFGLVFWLGGEQLVRLFKPEPAVLAIGAKLMLIAAAFQLFDGVATVKSGALNGAGDTRFVMLVGIASSWLLLVPLGWVLCIGAEMGAPGAWIALTLHIVFVAAVSARRWRGAAPEAVARRELARA